MSSLWSGWPVVREQAFGDGAPQDFAAGRFDG